MISPDWILQLFATDLADVRFPEVDAASLRAHHDAVEDAAKALAEAELVVNRMSVELAERKQALAQHQKRALAYMKIYAEERPALRERLESMQNARNPKNEEPKRRGRKRQSSEALVFVEGEGEPQQQLAS